MTRIAAIKALAPRAIKPLSIAVLVGMMVGGVPAQAGDRALFNPIGYSVDSRYLAFEEYGVSDGAGLAYSSIYLIDLKKDAWVIGTPIVAQADDEGVSVAEIRHRALEQASANLADLGVDVPAEMVAMIGDGEPGNDGTILRFGTPNFSEPAAISGDYELRLKTFETNATAPCLEWFAAPALGYELVIADKGSERLIHRDALLPRSRGCPQTYRLYGVLVPFEATSIAPAVAIIAVFPHGFEGPDRRFLAVPLGL